MREIIFSITLISSFLLSAQTVIVEEKYKKKNIPVHFKYLPRSEKFIIMKGKTIPMGVAPFIYNVYSFDINGNKNVILENEELMELTFSTTENTFKAYDLSKLRFNARYDYKYFFENKHIKTIPFEDLKGIGDYHFGKELDNKIRYFEGRSTFSLFSHSFNDFYELGFTNQKGKQKINLEKDDIYLEIIEIKTNTRKRTKLEKPDLTLLKGSSFAKDYLDPAFVSKLNGNENFDIITKSVSADFQTTILYKTTYDFEGKKIKELPLNLKLTGKYFIASGNDGGPKEITSVERHFTVHLGALSINHYLEDRFNGDIYVYGIFGDKKPNKIDESCKPKGFYVFKFDKTGKKLWESINYIDGKDYFERIRDNSLLQTDLLEYKNDLIFSVSVNSFTEFSNATIISKSNGEISKIKFIEYNNNTSKAKGKAFISNTYVSKDLKNKVFSQSTFVAMITNPNLLDYLKSIPKKGNRLYFENIFSDQGIWLIETDNKEYYKVLLFKD